MTARSPTGIPSALFSVPITEAEVRRLAGPAAYTWADRWQRDGHVFGAMLGKQELRARVQGVFEQIDSTAVRAYGRQVETECTCGVHARGTRICRHAATVLLDWVRDREAFEPVDETLGEMMRVHGLDDLDILDELAEYDDLELMDPVAGAGPLLGGAGLASAAQSGATAEGQLSLLLERYSMQALREMARGRKTRVTAKNKAELVQLLSVELSKPESVDAAITGLSDDGRLALAALDLAGGRYGAWSRTISGVYTALGGEGEMQASVPLALVALADLGLAIPQDVYGTPSTEYTLPVAVLTRVPLVPQVKKLAGTPAARDTATARDATPRLDLLQTMLVTVFELLSDRIGTTIPAVEGAREPKDLLATMAHGSPGSGVPSGWRVLAEHNESGPGGRAARTKATYFELAPLPSALSVPDLTHLVELTGQTVGMLDFASGLMLNLGAMALGVDSGRYRYWAHPNRMQALLALTPTERLDSLLAAWLSLPDSTELRTIVGPHKPLRLGYKQPAYYWGQPSAFTGPRGATARRLIANVIGRLALGEGEPVYSLSGFLELLWEAARGALGGGDGQQNGWWLWHQSKPDRRLKLSSGQDWIAVWRPLVETMVSGPMHWLGLVEPVMGAGGPTGFRVLPAAARLVGCSVHLDESVGARGLLFEVKGPEIVVVVPSGITDAGVHDMLLSIGVPVGASPQGMRYGLRVDGVRNAFERGTLAEELVHWLEDHASEPVPEGLRVAIETLGASYGTIRLYDDVALMEVADEPLLRELLARPAVRGMVVGTLSPRLIAVHTNRVDDLMKELTGLGYTPRLMEEGA